MGYRDDIEAAQNRIRQLENEVRDLKDEAAPAPQQDGRPPPRRMDGPTPDAGDSRHVPRRRTGSGVVLGVPLALILIAGACVVGCPLMTRACGAIGGETEQAMTALRRCERARKVLGEDVGWGAAGCANCEGEGGGDPINSGCHSSSSWQMPVSGSRGRGSYSFNFSSPAGGTQTFTSGFVTTTDGQTIHIPQSGECR